MASYRVSENAPSVDLRLIDNSVTFHHCFPEVVHLSSTGIVPNIDDNGNEIEDSFNSKFFQLLFDDYPVDLIDDDSAIISIEPYPDIIADFMANKLKSGINMRPDMAKSFFYNRLNAIDSFTLAVERESIFQSIFHEHKEFIPKIEFLYSSFNHYESSRKLIQFITVNELIETYLTTNKDYQLKEIIQPDMEVFRKNVYKRYHDLNFSFHDYTYKIADLIFIYDKENISRKNRNLELNLFSNIEMKRVGIKSPVPGYISFNNMFSQFVIPGEIYISELTNIPKGKRYVRQPIQQDPTILKYLKYNSDTMHTKRIHWRDNNVEENIQYLNNSLWARNTLWAMGTNERNTTLQHMNTVFNVYKHEQLIDNTVSLSLLPSLLAFTTILSREAKINNIIIDEHCVKDFALSLCRDNNFSYYNQDEMLEIVNFYLSEKGSIPPYLIVSTICV